MHFNGIWIPTEVVYTVFLGWGIIAVILLAIVFWPKRTRPLEQRSVKNKQVPKLRANLQSRINSAKKKGRKGPKRHL